MRTNMKNGILLFVFFSLLSLNCHAVKSAKTVSSPDKKTDLGFFLDVSGRPYYYVTRNNIPLIALSSLGLEGKEETNLSSGFKLKKTLYAKKDETWIQPWGENKVNREYYNEMAALLENPQGTKLTIRFRLFNDGLGFRYEYEVPQVDSVFVTNEYTEFSFAETGMSWSNPANFDTYEMLYAKKAIHEVTDANTPATFKTKSGIYASIHEAALYDFPEMALRNIGGTKFKSDLAAWPDGIKAKKGNRFSTSWRTLQIGEKAVDLINSSLILNLNEPCVLDDTDWIEPMKFVGIWWAMHTGVESWSMGDRHGATTENTKRYIDFAAANNIRGVLVEGWNEGWENWRGSQVFDYTKPYADFDIKEIIRYGEEKNVILLGHHESGGNISNYENQLDGAFSWYKNLGVGHVKTGYAGGMPEGNVHQGQFGVRHYQKVIETAAKYQITINAHETIKDTGKRRTWPNIMSRECGRSMEWNAWSEGNPTNHYEMLAFTRMLSGPFDYSPGVFDILLSYSKNHPDWQYWQGNMKDSRVNTTLAKQIANWVTIYSPVQMASDMIENYQDHPAFQFFHDFDPDCDKSTAFAGEPGEFVVMVRQAKDKFFLGATTNEEARTVDITLDFLPEGKEFNAVIYADGERADWKANPTDYRIERKTVRSSDSLRIVMAKGGGQAISFIPIGS